MSEEQTKTSYRIITLRTFIADRYLQFKSTKLVRCFPKFWETREVECWRFIPQESTAYVLGQCLNEKSCPTRLPSMQEGLFLNCFYGQEWDLKRFVSNHWDIQKYFDNLQRKRTEYVQKEREKNTAEAAGEIIEVDN